MASTTLELTRTLHEELETLERAMYKELGDPSTAKLKKPDQVARDQVVATLLAAHQSRCEQLTKVYEDADGARKEEIEAMSGSATFTSFYDQLKSIRDYHRRFPKEPVSGSEEQMLVEDVLEAAPDAGFTGEEAEGRYVDMHELHEMCDRPPPARLRPSPFAPPPTPLSAPLASPPAIPPSPPAATVPPQVSQPQGRGEGRLLQLPPQVPRPAEDRGGHRRHLWVSRLSCARDGMGWDGMGMGWGWNGMGMGMGMGWGWDG